MSQELIERPSTDIDSYVWDVPAELVTESRLRLPAKLTAQQALAERDRMKRVFARLKSYMNFLDDITLRYMAATDAKRVVVGESTFTAKPQMVYGVLPGHEQQLVDTLNELLQKGYITSEDAMKAAQVEIIPERKQYTFATVTLKRLVENYRPEVRQAIQAHWTATQTGTSIEVK